MRKSILIVDDSEHLREVLSLYLCERFNVVEAGGVQEALKQLERTEIHLIISDLNMPGLDGTDLVRSLKKAGRKCPIIIYSADPLMDEELLINLGAVACISKISGLIMIDQLLEKIGF